MKESPNISSQWLIVLLMSTLMLSSTSAFSACTGDSEVVAEYLFFTGAGTTATNTGIDGDDGNLTLTNGVVFNTNTPPSNSDCGWSVALPHSGSGSTTPAMEAEGFYDPLEGASNFTLMAWVKRESSSTGSNTSARIISDVNSAKDGVEFRFSGSTGKFALRINGTERSTSSAKISPTNNQWHHVAVVYDGTRPATNAITRNIHFYLDGVQRGLGNTLKNVVVDANTNGLTLGNSAVSRSIGNTMVGKMDDVIILYGVAPDAVGNGKTNEVIECYMNINDDIEWPSITAPSDVVVNTDPGQCSSTNVDLGTPTYSDNCTVDTVDNDAPYPFPSGITMVTWTVTDLAGNSDTSTQMVTVVDVEDPEIECPSNITVEAGACLAAVTNLDLDNPVATDNCGISSSNCTSPSAYVLGTNDVVWEVEDASGNSASCTQQVFVVPSSTLDCDGDGLTDAEELDIGTDPTNPDTDEDGMADGWEVDNGFNPRSDLLTTGLAAWWEFNDGAGSVASNSMSTNYTGALQNMDSSNWSTGVLDGALTFDGIDEYVSVAQSEAVITGGPFTIMAVVNLDEEYLADMPTIVSDCEQVADTFPTAGAGIPSGWVGGEITGSGDGTADWSVPSNGAHGLRAVFGGTGSASVYAQSRNSFITRSLVMQPVTEQLPQEWAFNMCYDSTNDTSASDNNRLRVWLWADGTNLASANGYAVEYGEANSDDRLRLWRITGGTKENFPIVSSGAAVQGGDVQFSVHVRREINGKWTLWSSSSTAANNAFPTSAPLSVISDEQIGYDSQWDVQGEGFLGFQVFIQTGANTSRNLALDDVAIRGQIQGYAIRHADILSGVTGDSASSSFASVSEGDFPYLAQWQSLALVNDETNLTLYVSGVPATNVPTIFNPAAQSTLYIGLGHDLPDETFLQGKIDDLRIYDHALTNLSASGVYDAINDPDQDGLINVDEYLNDTDPHDADSDDDGMTDAWEVANGLDPLSDDAASDPDGDGISNLVEFERNLSSLVWNGVQDITPLETVITATNSNPQAQFTYVAFETQQVTFSFYDFHYSIDPVTGDFDTYSSTLIDQVVTNVVVGTNTLAWDGLLTNGLLHAASVVKYEVLSTETDGGAHTRDCMRPIILREGRIYMPFTMQGVMQAPSKIVLRFFVLGTTECRLCMSTASFIRI